MAPAYSATKAYQINYMEALRKKAFKAGGKVIRKRKSKVYVTKRWHVLAIINKNLPFTLYKRM